MVNFDRSALQRVREQTLERYTNRFESYGADFRSLGWGSREQQRIRFEQLHRLYNFNGKRVLDIGCGFGDLFGFLCQENTAVDYYGVDLSQEFIEIAQKRHPTATFYHGDIFEQADTEPFDIVVMLGLMNFNQTEVDNKVYSRELLTKAWHFTKGVLICDFISSQRAHDYPQEPWIYYYSPEFIVSLVSSLTPSWAIIQDYPCIPQREMMVRLDRRPPNVQ